MSPRATEPLTEPSTKKRRIRRRLSDIPALDVARLPLTLPLGDRESPSDYLSRLSFRNGRDGILGICGDFGLDMQSVFHGSDEALRILSSLSGVDVPSLARHAFRKAEKRRFSYRGELLTSATTQGEQVRACPACLEEDLSRSGFRLEARPYRRAEWLIAPVRTCLGHGLSIVPLGRATGVARKDTSRVLGAAVADMPGVKKLSTGRMPSEFERYVLSRLDGARTCEWLDRLPLFAAMQTCSVFGLLALYGPAGKRAPLSDLERWECEATGYDIARGGEDGIRSWLDRMQSNFRRPGRKWGAQRVLGPLYSWLSHPNLDVAYGPLCDLVREHCVGTLPIPAGRRLLGSVVETRATHSVTSASRELGVSQRVLKSILQAKGIVGIAAATLPADKVTFDAGSADELLRDAKEIVSFQEARDLLGLPMNSKRAFRDSCLLVPWHTVGSDRPRAHMFRRSDVESFANRVRSAGDPRLGGDPDLLDVIAAARATTSTSVSIVALALEGRLRRVGLRQHAKPWLSLLVDPVELKALMQRRDTGYRSLRETSKLIGITPKTVTRLVRVGALRTVSVKHPVLNRATPIVTDEELDRFRDTYASLGELAMGLGTNGRGLRLRFAAVGIEPAFPADEIGFFLYRRSDLQRFNALP